ncbi:hypothetical protein MRX96_021017 [Rhipicephalus microplus]
MHNRALQGDKAGFEMALEILTGVATQADVYDTSIIIPNDSKKRLEELGFEVLRRVLEWARVAKAQAIQKETFCELFGHRQGGLGMKSCLTVRAERTDKAVAFKDSVQILDVAFDRSFSFFLHADALKARVETLLTCVNNVARFTGRSPAPEPKDHAI